MENEDETASYTRLYFAAAKLRALSFFFENGLMEEAIVPADVDQIKMGAGLLLNDLSEEVREIGREIETDELQLQNRKSSGDPAD